MHLRAGLELHLLGHPRIVLEGRDITAQVGAKPLGLVAYLARAFPATVPRAKVAATFWGDKTDEASRYRLRHALWMLRRALGEESILADESACRLGPDDRIWIDVHRFEGGCRQLGIGSPRPPRAAGIAGKLADLVALHRGEFLEGLVVRGAPLFEEWLLAERERLQLLYLEALWCLSHCQLAARDRAAAVRTLGRLVEADPLRERSYRALMAAHLEMGERSLALRVFRRCRDVLATELGVAPSPATRRLREMIARGTPPSAGEELGRAAELLRQGRPEEALASCAAAEALGADPATAGQIALLRAEIALLAGKHAESLSLIQAARRAVSRFLSG